MSEDDPRDVVYVHTDHNPDEVRTFYEVPEVIAVQVMAGNPDGTFAQGLADMIGLIRETAAGMDEARRALGLD